MHARPAAFVLLTLLVTSCSSGFEDSGTEGAKSGSPDRESGSARPPSGTALRQGIGLFRSGDMEGAEPHLLAALEEAPGEHRILEMIGAVYARTNRLRAAELRYLEALAIDPRSPSARLGLADVKSATGDLEGALREVEEARLHNPGHPVAAIKAALLLSRTGDGAAAEKAARRALDLDPDSPEAHYVLGLALEETGDLAAASGALIAALDRSPAHVAALSHLATVKARLGEDEAAADLRRRHREVLERRHVENRVGGRRLAAMDAFNREDYRTALEELQAIAREDPGDPEVHLYLGSTWLALGDYAESRRALQESLRLSPQSERAYMELGRLEGMENHLDAAAAALRRSIAINPEFAQPHYYLALLHRARGEGDLFRTEMKEFEQLRSKSGGSPMELIPRTDGFGP